MKYISLLCLLLIISCNSSVDSNKLHLLNGYWEIEEVRFPNGTKKEYTINSTVDFITIDSLKGFRKKVTPKFNGTYETSDDAEPLFITLENDSIFILYKNKLTSWQEVLLSLSQDNFSVKNKEGNIYHYKRFEPINITP